MKPMLVLFVAAPLLAACSQGGVYGQGPTISPTQSPSDSSISSAVPAPSPSPTLSSPPKVSRPWKPGQSELGIAIYWKNNPGDTSQSVREAAQEIFDYTVKLGANSVSLSLPFFTNGMNGTKIFASAETPSPAYVEIALQEAGLRGLHVSLRPLLDEANLTGRKNAWRGTITPSNRDAWFANYSEFMKPYLEVAQRNNAANFVIGVELNSMGDDPRWSGLIKRARSLFQGRIVYSANWDALSSRVARLSDQLGIDAYFDTKLSDGASQAQVTNTWNTWLKQMKLKNSTHTILSEVGIAADTGAYTHPALWGDPALTYNPAIQQKWFTAACQAYKKNQLAGIYYWRLNFGVGQTTSSSASDRGSFVDRPAASAISTCFASK